MLCDYCGADLEPGYVMPVDANGRPTEAICVMCSDVAVIERARRLGLPAPDLLDVFAAHLAREIPGRAK